ncbi:MAG: osmoprotectant NAGGN system M42 family peptidase [Bacillota bacterium]|nr:osmoprotectant NAGGN system M42 family peptidase [Bacillota bacterium]
MKPLKVDMDYMIDILIKLLNIPSPTGYTDQIVHFVGEELSRLGINFQLTRRGAIRAVLPGGQDNPSRAVVTHLDTLGAMVKRLKGNGRIEIVPIGNWSSRFAEGARITLFTDEKTIRGTILPILASGHTFDKKIDQLKISWENVEVRIDENCQTEADLNKMGVNVGDYIAVDASPETSESGYINARHLDNKAGVALVLGTAKALWENNAHLPVTCKLLFTIAEEVGVGASTGLQEKVAEMVTVDNATVAEGQNSSEMGATICMMDSAGPFDYHLSHRLISLCREYKIIHSREVFKYYSSDSASALAAGNDLRTALVGFGVDASHGYERVHINSLNAVASLLTAYLQTELTCPRDQINIGPLNGFPTQPGINIEIEDENR